MAANDWRWKRTFYKYNTDDSAFLGIKSSDADKWGNDDKSNRTPYYFADETISHLPDCNSKTLRAGSDTAIASTCSKAAKNNAGDDSSDGNGSGATFDMTINDSNTVTALTINSGGSGYGVEDRILIPHTTTFNGGALGNGSDNANFGYVDFAVKSVDGSGAITAIKRKWSNDDKTVLLQVLHGHNKALCASAFPLTTFSDTDDADTKLGLDGAVYVWAECSAVSKALVDSGKGLEITMTFASESAQTTFKNRVDAGAHPTGVYAENDTFDH